MSNSIPNEGNGIIVNGVTSTESVLTFAAIIFVPCQFFFLYEVYLFLYTIHITYLCIHAVRTVLVDQSTSMSIEQGLLCKPGFLGFAILRSRL